MPQQNSRADDSQEPGGFEAPIYEPDDILEPQPGLSRDSRLLASVLDDLFRIPGTSFGIGLDAIIGIIPGIGDLSTTIAGAVIIIDSMRNRLPLPVLGRMAVNLAIDAVLGTVPIVGDLLDIAHRANRRNLKLLERSLSNRERTKKQSKAYLILATGIVAVCLVALMSLLVWGLWVMWKLTVG